MFGDGRMLGCDAEVDWKREVVVVLLDDKLGRTAACGEGKLPER